MLFMVMNLVLMYKCETVIGASFCAVEEDCGMKHLQLQASNEKFKLRVLQCSYSVCLVVFFYIVFHEIP